MGYPAVRGVRLHLKRDHVECATRFYLRKRVLKLVLLSQVPFKFVNLFFTLRIS